MSQPVRGGRRAAGMVALCLGLLLVGPSLADQRRMGQDGAVALSDCDGAIAEIALHYDTSALDYLLDVYADLFHVLPRGVKVEVVCSSGEAVREFRRHWGQVAARGRELVLINVNRPITIWARDRRIARVYNDGEPAPSFVPTLAPDYGDDQINDLDVPWLLAPRNLVPGVCDSFLHLEGGNLVSNGRHTFVGSNIFADNEYGQRTVYREFARLFGTRLIFVADENGGVPWCHADMYLTPIDRSTVLLAEMSPAVDRLDDIPRAELPGWLLSEEPALRPHARIVDRRLLAVARQLTEQGYLVLRQPAIWHPGEEWIVTYNNVLMEKRRGRRIVYMPTYGLGALDQAAAATWQSLGFVVRTIDVSGVFELGGAIRCLANVTRRQPANVPLPRLHARTRILNIPAYEVDSIEIR